MRIQGIAVAGGLAACLAGSVFAKGLVIVPDSGQINVPVTSMKGIQFMEVVRQRYDFSCGSAAVATLLTHHYEDPVPERNVLVNMFKTSENNPKVRAKVKKEGFSMLDVKNYLTAKGYQAGGYRLSYQQLKELRVPAIVLIDTKGFKHFVVVKGIRNGDVLLGDPALGIRSLTKEQFEEQWYGPTVLIRDRLKVARTNFNRKGSWALRPDAPTEFGTAENSLQSFYTTLPSMSDF